MSLTDTERKLVAQRAMTYPVGYGHQWLALKVVPDSVDDAIYNSTSVLQACLRELNHKNANRLARYGCPATKLAFSRGGDMILYPAMRDIANALGISTNTYCSILNKFPKTIGRVLKKNLSSETAREQLFDMLLKYTN